MAVYTLSRSEIKAEPLDDMREATAGTPFWWTPEPHLPYRLLRCLCRAMKPNFALELGTGTGASAAAMAPYCRLLITRDVADYRAPWFTERCLPDKLLQWAYVPICVLPEYSSVRWQRQEINDVLWAAADLIFLDVGPHDGIQEKGYMDRFAAFGFKGILILDDMATTEYPGMLDLWDTITLPKLDLTEIGHTCGTGAVFYGEDRIEVVECAKISLSPFMSGIRLLSGVQRAVAFR